jgi:hypothetical protein
MRSSADRRTTVATRTGIAGRAAVVAGADRIRPGHKTKIEGSRHDSTGEARGHRDGAQGLRKTRSSYSHKT